MRALTFSVIVPTYRRPDKLIACLQSLAEQTCSPSAFEVIVVDDAGMRATLAPILEAAQPLACRLLSQENRGAAAARNAGAALARGRLLAFTDDDCQPEPNWLEMLERAMTAESGLALVGGRVVNVLVRDRFASATQALVDFLVERGSLGAAQGRLLTSNNLCVSSVAFQELGGFDEAFCGAGGEDREFCLRWAHGARPSVYAPEAVVRHAHDMTLAGFVRQHYAYGRGSALLRQRALAHGYGPLPLERASFYWELLRYPQRTRGMDADARVQQSLLFLLSQVANTVGHLEGRLRQAK